ncbi:MAG TPA: apolipoprotein N-acyltransferase [Caulobacteraceae bacterium]
MLLAGVVAALAHPPWGFAPGLFGFALIFALVDRTGSDRPIRSAFFRGWLAGCGYFAVALFWLLQPFFIDAKEQGWMAPFAVALVDMGMALFWGAAAAVYGLLAGKSVMRVILFAGALSAFEWLRGHLLTGFPWDLPGEAWRAGSPPSQVAAAVGAYGLTWITLTLFSVPVVVRQGRAGKLLLGAAVISAATIWIAGAMRLSSPYRYSPHGPWVRIVQANVRQETKYDLRLFRSIVDRYVALTALPSPHQVEIIVWPEGAVPAPLEDYLSDGTWTARAIAAALRPGQTLLVGGYRWARGPRGGDVAFNSLAAVRRSGGGVALLALYDKYRLVPFGEFMPLDSLASRLGVKQFVHVGGGFAPGPRPRPLRIEGLPAAQPLICYESLFPGFTRQGAALSGVRPAWIVNVSNDAWFGTGSGPRQHLNLASYRAIEEGLPMVRATPTGISAVIDAFGRVAPGKALGIGAFGVIDAPLPPALPPTLFSRFGDAPFFLMLILSAACARWAEVIQARPRQ